MSELLDFLQKTETKKFIQEHLHEDVTNLRLNPPDQLGSFAPQVADQILSRQKAKRKLDSWTGNFDLILPPPLSIEQASSEKTATYKKSILKGNRLIDLTGGMGVDTLALSENFVQTTYVEQQVELAQIFEHNRKILGAQIEVVTNDAVSFLEKFSTSNKSSTAIYIDPARRDESKDKVFNLEDCSPNIVALLPRLRKCCNQVLIKLSPFLDIKLILQSIPNVKEIHVVSIKNECKELLILVDFSFENEPKIKTINIGDPDQVYDFSFSEELSSESLFGISDHYILEPNSSILKAGAFNKVSADFGVTKLHPNTHLYSSESQIEGWPGRTFEVIESRFDKKLLSKYAATRCINVLTRNYPTNSATIKKKFKVKDGGEYFLIGFSGIDKKNHLVVAKKIEESNH